jgi:hypothetical protein
VDVVEAARFLIQTRARFVDEHLAEIEALYEKTRKSADSPEDATAADISEAVSDAFHGILIDVASENIRAQELEAHIGRLYDAVWEHKHLSMALSEKGMTFEGFRELAERATAAADSALTMAQVEAAIARLEEVVDANPAYAPAWKNLGRMEEVRRAMDRATA